MTFGLQRRKQYQFLVLLLALAMLISYRFWGFEELSYWVTGITAGFVLIGFFIPVMIAPVLIIWFFIGKVLGEIMSWVLLSLLYFLFIWMAKFFVGAPPKGGWKRYERKENDYSKMG